MSQLPDLSYGNIHPLSLVYDPVDWNMQDQIQVHIYPCYLFILMALDRSGLDRPTPRQKPHQKI